MWSAEARRTTDICSRYGSSGPYLGHHVLNCLHRDSWGTVGGRLGTLRGRLGPWLDSPSADQRPAACTAPRACWHAEQREKSEVMAGRALSPAPLDQQQHQLWQLLSPSVPASGLEPRTLRVPQSLSDLPPHCGSCQCLTSQDPIEKCWEPKEPKEGGGVFTAHPDDVCICHTHLHPVQLTHTYTHTHSAYP